VPRTRLPSAAASGGVGQKYGFRIANVFHAADGNLHPNVLSMPASRGDGARAGSGQRDHAHLRGRRRTITGEHGIGTEKRKFMHWIFSDDDLEVMAG